MKFDFESLSTEPLFYMLMHSGAFVIVLGFTFFVIGLLFGYATWGRYKRQTRELRGKAESMKEEIAGLKRKLGDHAVKSGPAVAMATETIYMPKKEDSAAPAEAAPAAVTEEIQAAQEPLFSASNRSPNSHAAEGADATREPRSTDPATAIAALFPDEPPPPPAHHSSPLAGIIAIPPVKDEHAAADEPPSAAAGLVPADILPELTDLSMTPLPAVEIQPVVDPKLGLIYHSQPKETDDLTALKGIAQVLEKRLHEFGIYTYAQIAAWDEDQVKEFSSRLSFKDRIQREHWVEQARQLADRQKHAEAA